VNDKNALNMTRTVAKQEGLFIGGSCGAAVFGALEYAQKVRPGKDALMVVILPDSGTRYVSKIYNDDWMRKNNFLD